MKPIALLVALTFYAALPVRAETPAPDPNEINTRNCVRAMSAQFTEAQINAPDYAEKAQFKDRCFDKLVAEREHRQEQELRNRSPDTELLNCVRLFFSIAADGTEYQVRPQYQNCTKSPDCTATLTLLATDGIQTAQEKTNGGLINVVLHDTGRWLTLKSGEFSCKMPEQRAANLR